MAPFVHAAAIKLSLRGLCESDRSNDVVGVPLNHSMLKCSTAGTTEIVRQTPARLEAAMIIVGMLLEQLEKQGLESKVE